MLNRTRFRLAWCALAIAALVGAPSRAGSQTDLKLQPTNNLKFNQRVSLPGVVLPAGTYVFERDVNANTGIVRVLSPNRQKLLFLGYTHPAKRPSGLKGAIEFEETARGEPLRIVAWYPLGSSQGHRFVYH